MSENFDIVYYLSLILPFANETAIVLTHSKLPFFKGLYDLCIDDVLLEGIENKRFVDKICNMKKYSNKIIIDLIAYLGIILYICNNTVYNGYAIGVSTGIVLILFSIIIPNMFLGITIEKITKYFKVKNPYLYITIGIFFIILLILITSFFEFLIKKITQYFTKDIKTNTIN